LDHMVLRKARGRRRKTGLASEAESVCAFRVFFDLHLGAPWGRSLGRRCTRCHGRRARGRGEAGLRLTQRELLTIEIVLERGCFGGWCRGERTLLALEQCLLALGQLGLRFARAAAREK